MLPFCGRARNLPPVPAALARAGGSGSPSGRRSAAQAARPARRA